MKSLLITRKEVAKVTHDINNVWHSHFKKKGEELCVIYTHSNKPDSPSYAYVFLNHGFDNNEFIAKYPAPDGR